MLTEFEHLSENADRTGVARLMRNNVEHAAQRGRARVIGVVDEGDAITQLSHRSPAIGRLQAGDLDRDLIEPNAAVDCHRGRGKHVQQVASSK